MAVFPTENQNPFTREAILALPTTCVGVYGIWNSQYYIYVGRGNIRDRMMKHLNGDKPEILDNNPTGWSYFLCLGDPVPLEKKLTLLCNPVCCERVG